jgi:hypothetical protein
MFIAFYSLIIVLFYRVEFHAVNYMQLILSPITFTCAMDCNLYGRRCSRYPTEASALWLEAMPKTFPHVSTASATPAADWTSSKGGGKQDINGIRDKKSLAEEERTMCCLHMHVRWTA